MPMTDNDNWACKGISLRVTDVKGKHFKKKNVQLMFIYINYI